MKLWWLSYVHPERGFVGAVLVRAFSLLEACQLAATLSLRPECGGEVMGVECPPEEEEAMLAQFGEPVFIPPEQICGRPDFVSLGDAHAGS